MLGALVLVRARTGWPGSPSFLDPFADPTDGGFQAIRGMYALATGGLWGVGLGNSAMKWNLLPHAESDYIFAIIGEELGFLGCLVVVTLYGVLAYAGFRIARRSADRFVQLASVAITVWLVGQAAMNMGYVVGLLPVTGVQLPLISAGGTSLVLTLFIVGLLARFARSEPAAIEAQRGRRARPARPAASCPCRQSAVDPVRPRRRPEDRPPARPVVSGGRTVVRRGPTPAAAAPQRVPPADGRPAGARPAASRRRAAPPPSRRARGEPHRPLSVVLAGRRHRRAHRADARPRRRPAPPVGRGTLRITCLGTARGMETRLVPARGYDLRLIPPVPLPRKPTVDLLRVPGRVWRAVAETRALLDELRRRRRRRLRRLRGAAGLPGRPAGRRCRSSCTSRTRCPGLANRVGARLAARVAVTAPGTPLHKGEHVGMPLRTAISSLDRAAPPRRGPRRVRPGRRPADPARLRRLAGRGDAEPGGRRRRRRADRRRGAGAARPRAEEHRRDGSRPPGG